MTSVYIYIKTANISEINYKYAVAHNISEAVIENDSQVK